MAFIIIVSIYSALIIVLAFGFARLEEKTEPKDMHIYSISVVVPVRNEGDNTCRLLDHLSHIKYPKEKWEVILIDDHSTDDGIENIDVNFYDFRINKLSLNTTFGKKAAITAAIEVAKGDIILTTDADCTVGPLWIEKVNLTFQDAHTQMIIGGVRIQETKTFFSRLQSLEFVSVAATGAATLGLGFPTMCNAANLAYRRDAFTEVDGYKGNERVSSGDDEFLMNKFKKSSVKFLYDQDTLVTTSPRPDVTSFFHQRLRWAGKWSSNTSISTQIFAIVVWLFHLAFILMTFSAVFGFISWKLFAILAGAKGFVESLFLIPAANFFRVNWRWISFLVLQFVYSFYVISVGFMSQILLPEWKGRAVETKV